MVHFDDFPRVLTQLAPLNKHIPGVKSRFTIIETTAVANDGAISYTSSNFPVHLSSTCMMSDHCLIVSARFQHEFKSDYVARQRPP